MNKSCQKMYIKTYMIFYVIFSQKIVNLNQRNYFDLNNNSIKTNRAPLISKNDFVNFLKVMVNLLKYSSRSFNTNKL